MSGVPEGGTSAAASVEAQFQKMAGVITELRGEVGRLQQELASRQQAAAINPPAAEPAAPVSPILAHVTSTQGLEHLPKMPKPKGYGGSQLPGAAENFLFNCS
jgi:hypothetical protein